MVHISKKRTLFPAAPSEAQQIKLSSFDLQMLFVQYIRKALLYQAPAQDFSSHVERLAEALSEILVKFYPLAGRLTTNPLDGGIYILCNDSGVDFIEATAEELIIADLTTAEVTSAREELFPLNGAINFEGHRFPLLGIQVTQLKDGVAVCFTINHAVADGVSVTNFLNSWSRLCRTEGNGNEIPVNPIFDRSLLPPGNGPVTAVTLNLNPGGDVERSPPPPLRLKMFHFSAHMISRLKERANRDSSLMIISSFHALCAHVWRSVTRARCLGPHERTTCYVAIDCRPRVVPPLPASFFGNVVQNIRTTATCGELISSSLSFSAALLNAIIAGHTNEAIRERIIDKPPVFEKNGLLIVGSAQFQSYETDFGWGRPVALRSGPAYRFDGKMTAYPGREGGGSIELELCLASSVMAALESDPEFISHLPLIQSMI